MKVRIYMHLNNGQFTCAKKEMKEENILSGIQEFHSTALLGLKVVDFYAESENENQSAFLWDKDKKVFKETTRTRLLKTPIQFTAFGQFIMYEKFEPEYNNDQELDIKYPFLLIEAGIYLKRAAEWLSRNKKSTFFRNYNACPILIQDEQKINDWINHFAPDVNKLSDIDINDKYGIWVRPIESIYFLDQYLFLGILHYYISYYCNKPMNSSNKNFEDFYITKCPYGNLIPFKDSNFTFKDVYMKFEKWLKNYFPIIREMDYDHFLYLSTDKYLPYYFIRFMRLQLSISQLIHVLSIKYEFKDKGKLTIVDWEDKNKLQDTFWKWSNPLNQPYTNPFVELSLMSLIKKFAEKLNNYFVLHEEFINNTTGLYNKEKNNIVLNQLNDPYPFNYTLLSVVRQVEDWKENILRVIISGNREELEKYITPKTIIRSL